MGERRDQRRSRVDDMTGGLGFDEFRFSMGDSGPSFNDADTDLGL